jgi:hypothetical protein
MLQFRTIKPEQGANSGSHFLQAIKGLIAKTAVLVGHRRFDRPFVNSP